MRGVVLLSGGLDSGVAAALFAAHSGQQLVAAVFCDYGQRAAQPEHAAATRLAQRFGVPLTVLALPWLGTLARAAGSALLAGGGELPRGTAARPGDAASAARVWVPARNALFVAAAAAVAESCGADAVVAGFNREEAATFPDNSAEFVAAATALLRLGTRSGVRVVSPTLAFDKPQIQAAALRLGFTAADFWSCYEGGAQPCGTCESCLRSRFAR
ncbi:MAG: 7-cyano-7-deazaguanine synthase QueC [Planctomycetes bacterium]|nr:7-cyano-7-deazaguanine synthase QueC [Planctomycetota bacterium]